MISRELVARVHGRIVRELPPEVAVDAGAVRRILDDEEPLLTVSDRERVVARVLAGVHGLGPLEPVLADPDVSDVIVNGPGPVWIERRGRLQRLELRLDAPALAQLIERIVAPLGLRADRSSPLVDARLPDGSRVNVVMPPLAVDGPYLTIRRFAALGVPVSAFAAPPVEALLRWAVAARANIVVSGGTGSGKTTLLNALAGFIATHERVVTVEDAAELRLGQRHVARLEARPANAEGAGATTIRDLVRNALRMRPDRIVVGEVRGPEALDMLQAMNTGHDGSLSTCHANSPVDALRRLETMVLMGSVDLPLWAVRDQVRAAVDLVVQVRRHADGRRSIVEVAEVVPPAADAADASTTSAPMVRVIARDDAVVDVPRRAPREPGAGPLPMHGVHA